MTNPNIVTVAYIYGQSTNYAPSSTSAVSLLNNAASSGLVYKIDTIIACNTSASAVTATVSVYPNAATQGSAPSGTASPIAYQVTVPPNASVVISDKTTAFYLLENQCIGVTSGTANNLNFFTSYESISD